jgi:hypothetical protein
MSRFALSTVREIRQTAGKLSGGWPQDTTARSTWLRIALIDSAETIVSNAAETKEIV